MREAIGGSWIFGIVALFIALFSGFLAYSVSYTKAFKVKNEIINMIERSEGFTTSTSADVSNLGEAALAQDESVEAQAYAVILKMGYNSADIDCSINDTGVMMTGGYCVKKVCAETGETEDTKVYYKVTTYIKLKLPVFNIMFKVPIAGETKALYYENTDVTFECFK